MAGALTAAQVFEQVKDAAADATGPDEQALQIDYDALKTNIQAALGVRKVWLI
jgi:hypothetical protein